MAALPAVRVCAEEETSRDFKTYRECFAFIAAQENLAKDDETVLKLAAESGYERHLLFEKTGEEIAVVKASFYGARYNQIRGAQDNGRYYVFRIRPAGFTFVGTLEGNAYACGTENGVARFTCSLHWGANESIENVYVWNGRMFEQVSSDLYRVEDDGTPRRIRSFLDKAAPSTGSAMEGKGEKGVPHGKP